MSEIPYLESAEALQKLGPLQFPTGDYYWPQAGEFDQFEPDDFVPYDARKRSRPGKWMPDFPGQQS